MKQNWLKIIIWSCILTLASACVGTIENKNSQKSNVLNTTSSTGAISFDGIYKATAIAHDKIEILFRPAVASTEVVYELYIDNSSIPLKLYEKALIKNAAGYYYYLLTGKKINTTYMLNMKAVPVDNTTSQTNQIDTSKSVYVTTFNNETADFLGISSVSLAPGEAGRESVVIKWTQATILGTDLTIRQTDPIAYEIRYISSVGGVANINNSAYLGADKVTLRLPSVDSVPPALSRLGGATISRLQAGTTYYFQVRAIHLGYNQNFEDVFYKHEENTKYLKITTLSDSGVFDFPTGLATIAHPLGETGLRSLDVGWVPATGGFNHYRVCYKKVADPEGMSPLNDLLQDADLNVIINNPSYCLKIDPSQTTTRLSDLVSYAYYQAKVLACRTADCGERDRITSNLLSSRVYTNLAQFAGIKKVLNPSDEASLDQVGLQFDPPLISSGFLTTMKLYCYNEQNDSSPVALPLDGSFSDTSKVNCNGIAVKTTLPNTLSDFGTFSNLSLQFSSVIDGSKTYCLALVPVIESSYMGQSGVAGANVVCFTPAVQTPTIVDFPGKSLGCTSSTGRNLSFDWPTPSAGLYSKFLILYREKVQGSEFFSFQDAVKDYLSSNPLSPYKWVDSIDKSVNTYDLTDLKPGTTYSIGILTYLTNGTAKIFSQYNNAIEDCYLPTPSALFDEWVDIFAVGPKEDGLTPSTAAGLKKRILETLDDEGIPVELALNQDEISIDASDAFSASKTSLIPFDGVYGAKEGNTGNVLNQYSNTGIVKLMWKDVSFFSNTATMKDFIANYETATNKWERKYGYRVYRSDDNQLTWLNISSYSLKNKFQTFNNSGLIQPKSFTWRKRNNSESIVENIASFTDYSVQYAAESGEVDRARIYWYKIVPVFNGKEVSYSDIKNPSHHVVRVTLPPRNMALVHRMMANRTICNELNKPINKEKKDHYSCAYNGLGASGLTSPWVVGDTVYDLGGDLLVDRFELSCPFTRGDPSFANSDSEFDGLNSTFTGLSKYNNGFRGCFSANPWANLESIQGSTIPTVSYNYKQVIPGDCFGSDTVSTVHQSTTLCLDPAKVAPHHYIYPGSNGFDLLTHCNSQVSNLGPNAFNMSDPTSFISQDESFFPTQSEAMAVYYMRTVTEMGSWFTHTPVNFVGGNGKTFSPTGGHAASCWVNLAYTNNAGTYRPRWIPVNYLFQQLKVSGPENRVASLYDKTPNQILADSDFYDQSNVLAPTFHPSSQGRLDPAKTKLGRLVSSNSAKLPPLGELTQLEYNNICSLYKVDVGIKTDSTEFLSHSGVYSKRLLRRKEYIAASAWPQTYDSAKVSALEKGSLKESNGNYSGCNSDTREVAPGTDPVGVTLLEKGMSIPLNFSKTSLRTNPPVLTGSSSRDQRGTNYSTEKCVSRFGVQDLVGNYYESTSEQVFCDFTQDVLYLGDNGDQLKSSLFTNTNWVDPLSISAWVFSKPSTGSCSLLESGANSGVYQVNGVMLPIKGVSGLNSSIVKVQKSFDQDSVVSARNGDGGFLDFGQKNIAAPLTVNNILDMEVEDNPSIYFNPVFGLPLTCTDGVGCSSLADDNLKITSDRIALKKGYTDINNPYNIEMLNFPTNNSRFANTGVGTYREVDGIDAINIVSDTNYISGVNTGADSEDPEDNYVEYSLMHAGDPSPSRLVKYDFTIPRGQEIKMYSGGSSTSQAGRYSLTIDGRSDEEERIIGRDVSGRCSVLINQDFE